MIGKIIEIIDSKIHIKLIENFTGSIIDKYIITMKGDKILVAEVCCIENGLAYADLIGEIVNEKFILGVITRPNVDSQVYLLSKEKVPLIIGSGDVEARENLLIGNSSFHNIPITVPIDEFFSQHFAIFGSTGSGKSSGFARIIQNLFQKKNVPINSSIIIFDAYGEYANAFQNISSYNQNLSFKSYTTNLKMDNIIHIPVWLLGVDDLASLLCVDKPNQLLIIEKALRLVRIFKSSGEDVIKYQNSIIAKSILDIMLSGSGASQIRDQIFSILTYYKTKDLSLDVEVFQPGYTRSLKNCLLIDKDGKLSEMELLVSFFSKFIIDVNEDDLKISECFYTLDDLEKAFDFALINEGVFKSDKVYDDFNVLKVRVHSLATGPNRVYFDYDHYITRNEYIGDLLFQNNMRAQIVNFNINYVDDRLAKTITKIYSKMFYDFVKELPNRASFPIHIVLEEAHRYVQNDEDFKVLNYNIFERIAKEGRKYGILLGIISQRPNELSQTVVSQCNNFIVFRMIHHDDLTYIRRMLPNMTDDLTEKIKSLQPGHCIGFGTAFKLPLMITIEKPNPIPSSENCHIVANWFSNQM